MRSKLSYMCTIHFRFLWIETVSFCALCFRWNQIFNSRVVATLFEYGNFYFNVIVIVMALLLAGKEELKLKCLPPLPYSHICS